MRLLTMKEFVLKQDEWRKEFNRHENQHVLHNIINYANFLDQPLKKEMLAPLGESGAILCEPEAEMCCPGGTFPSNVCGCMGQPINEEWWVWHKADKRVLFKNYQLGPESIDELVEYVFNIEEFAKFGAELTENGLIKAGLKHKY